MQAHLMQSSKQDSASLADAVLGLLWRPRALKLLSSRRPVVLMYHSAAPGPGDYFGPDVFERHVRSLKSRYHVVGPEECRRVRSRTEEIDVLLTFDDGFLNNAVYVAPILKRHQVPAIFFVSTRHCSGGRTLWFAYLSALSRWFPEDELVLDGVAYDLGPRERKRSLRRLRDYLLSLRPHPQAMYEKIERSLPSIGGFVPPTHLTDHYAGMTWDHIREISRDPLFEIGVHTVDHPFLTLCDEGEMAGQIRVNREELERVTGKQLRSIAYPLGDYDARVVAKCMDLGIEERYAVDIRRGTGDGRRETKDEGRGTGDRRRETKDRRRVTKNEKRRTMNDERATSDDIPRVGIYRPSLSILGFKVQWGNVLRRTPLRFG